MSLRLLDTIKQTDVSITGLCLYVGVTIADRQPSIRDKEVSNSY